MTRYMIIDVAYRKNISWAFDLKYVEDTFDVFDHMCFSLRTFFRYVANYSVGVLFIVDIFVNDLICAAHSFIRFIKLVDSINWVFIGIHILFSALCAFACTARIKGTGREAVAVSLLLCHASYTGVWTRVYSYQLCTVVNCNPFDKMYFNFKTNTILWEQSRKAQTYMLLVCSIFGFRFCTYLLTYKVFLIDHYITKMVFPSKCSLAAKWYKVQLMCRLNF